MKKPSTGPIIATVLLASLIALLLREEWRKKRDLNANGNLSVEEIMKKREEGADRALTSPLASLIQQKKWAEFDQQYEPGRDGPALAGVVRSLYIKGLMAGLTPADQDRLLLALLKSAALHGKDKQAVLNSLLGQIERLPAPDPGSPSFLLLDEWLKDREKTSAILQRTALIKLAYQETSPEERHLAALKRVLFDHPIANNSLDEWISRLEIMKSDSAAVEVCKHLIRHLDRIPAESLSTLLRAVSGHPGELFRETLLLLKKTTALESPYAIEASFMAIERLVKAGKAGPKELDFFENYAQNLDGAKLIQPLRLRREDLLRLLAIKPAASPAQKPRGSQ